MVKKEAKCKAVGCEVDVDASFDGFVQFEVMLGGLIKSKQSEIERKRREKLDPTKASS